MNYIYGKIKNIKVMKNDISFEFESDWKIEDYNKNEVLYLYCNKKNDNEQFIPYNKEARFSLKFSSKNNYWRGFIFSLNYRCKIEFTKDINNSSSKSNITLINSLEIIDE